MCELAPSAQKCPPKPLGQVVARWVDVRSPDGDGCLGGQGSGHDAVAVGPGTSRTRDTDPAAAAALDYGLSQRTLIAVSGRTDTVAQLITRRIVALATAASRPSMSRPCVPWSARPSAPHRLRRPPVRRRIPRRSPGRSQKERPLRLPPMILSTRS
ncbi:hypothetical protein Smic_85010 [Streptomyces microflavus]|uniref:Uncharacterized protein n=1 Tax=Streptomyces microflavus TaxID=1919 RepID=A0A7J0D7A6_STRMI|nr:hypothetical protein Smic_85010 [Streptomyces microflavus]